jgi:hypothetical protein
LGRDVTPWVWSVALFDLTAHATVSHQIFPTYSIYIDGQLSEIHHQHPQEEFIPLNSSNTQMRVSDIQ